MTLKFNPPKQVARYALWLSNASAKYTFRTYNTLGDAKNAYHFRGYRQDAKILENVDGQWYVLHDIPAGTPRNELPWYKEVQGGYYSNYRTSKKAVPMTREEYAEWRLAVERERIADGSASLNLNPGQEFLSDDAYDSAGITVIR